MAFLVYKITNKENGKSYIGYTHLTVEQRWIVHVRESRGKQRHTIHFKNAIRLYGSDCWKLEILAQTDNVKSAKEIEISMINIHDTYKNGYNSTIGGDGSNGHIKSEETRRKLSKANKGKDTWLKGKTGVYSEETIQKKQKSASKIIWLVKFPDGSEVKIVNKNNFCKENFGNNWKNATKCISRKWGFNGYFAVKEVG